MNQNQSVENYVPMILTRDLEEIADYYLQKIRGKTFLITGGNGFLAYYLTLTLLLANDRYNLNNQILLLVRNEQRSKEKYGPLGNRKDLQLLVQDVCMPLAPELPINYIIHAASSADAKHFDEDPIGVFNSNVLGTENIIRFLQTKHCTSTVFVSSFTVYGNTNLVSEVAEDYYGADAWNNNRACYSYGKRCAEFLCMTACRKYGLPIKIVRPGFVYGFSSKDDKRVYSEIINCVSNKKEIILQSSGYVYRSMIYVTDVCRGILGALFSGKDGEAYNIANEFISIRNFAECAVKVSKSSKVTIKYLYSEDRTAVPPDKIWGRMDSSKLRNECSWEPRVTIEQGIAMAAGIAQWKNTTLTG